MKLKRIDPVDIKTAVKAGKLEFEIMAGDLLCRDKTNGECVRIQEAKWHARRDKAPESGGNQNARSELQVP